MTTGSQNNLKFSDKCRKVIKQHHAYVFQSTDNICLLALSAVGLQRMLDMCYKADSLSLKAIP